MDVKELYYGTTNPAKLQYMRDSLQGLPLHILAPPCDAQAEENGDTPLENARIKALAYYALLKKPVFAADSGLYIEGLPDKEQPGTHVRRVDGKRLNDGEMILHYTGIARSMGGFAKARYRNGICLILADGVEYAYDGDDIATDWFYLASAPHPDRREGFPLDSISVRIQDLRYYNDITSVEDEHLNSAGNGFSGFFQRALGIGAAR